MQRIAVPTSFCVKRLGRQASLSLGAMLLLAGALPAQAQLFSDDDARKAIIALRTEVRAKIAELEANHIQTEQALRRQIEASANGQLELVRQLEQLRAELADLRGAVERATQTGSQAKSQQKDLFALESQIKTLDARIALLEPQRIKLDEVDVLVAPAEKATFESAQSLLREAIWLEPLGPSITFVANTRAHGSCPGCSNRSETPATHSSSMAPP